MGEQLIFKRTEIKYILKKGQYTRLKELLVQYMLPDEHGLSHIQSLYYDTPSYLLIRRSMEHPIYKEKIRVRSYGIANQDSKIFIELKKKYDAVVYKRRMEIQEKKLASMINGQYKIDNQIGREIYYCFSNYDDLRPTVLLLYEREAFYGRTDHDFRLTFDQNILWRDYDLDLKKGIYGWPILGEDEVLLEVKVGGAIPKWLIEFFSKEHIYKSSFSKYGRAYQMIKERK